MYDLGKEFLLKKYCMTLLFHFAMMGMTLVLNVVYRFTTKESL